MYSKVFILAVTGALAASAAVPSQDDWQDCRRLSAGAERARAAFVPFSSVSDALKLWSEHSDRVLSLDSDSDWRFSWAPDPVMRPKNFWRVEFDDSRWDRIAVPSSWQALGAGGGKRFWGTAIYLSDGYSFQPDAVGGSRVTRKPPADYTSAAARDPTGCYRRTFSLPEGWERERVFLKFDGVASFFRLWVNGEYVGFAKDSRSPSEFDVTSLVHRGENLVAVEVLRYCDGSYLEDRDTFRLSGISRSVWLLRRPERRIVDFSVETSPVNAADLTGAWLVRVRSAEPLGAALFDAGLKEVAASTNGVFVVDSPALWTPETPNCYRLVVSNGCEFASTLVGFRTVRFDDGRLLLNGRPLELHGVSRREFDPTYGDWVPPEVQELDVRLLREARCNAVWNALGPADDRWYALCDLNGLCVIDEANISAPSCGNGEMSLSHQPAWEEAYVSRVVAMAERNRNHPCVVAWSLGRRSGAGENLRTAAEALHALDAGRPVFYDGGDDALDIAVADAVAPEGAPFAAWADLAMWRLADGERRLVDGRSIGGCPNAVSAVASGCVDAARTPNGRYYALRHAHRLWTAEATNDFRRLVIANRCAFSGADGVECRWTGLCDGTPIASGMFDVSGLGPGEERLVDFPEFVRQTQRVHGGIVALRVRFSRGEDVLSLEQIDLPYETDVLPRCKGTVDCKVSKTFLAFAADEMKIVFDRRTGLPASIRERGLVWDSERLPRPMRFTLDGDAAPVAKSVALSDVTAEGDGSLTFTAEITWRRPAEVWTMVKWRIRADGVVMCWAWTDPPQPGQPPVRMEIGWSLNGANPGVRWFGRGPWACGPDCLLGAHVGEYFAYAKDSRGWHEAAYGVKIGDLTLRTLGAPFAFGIGETAAVGSDDGRLALTISVGDASLLPRKTASRELP